MDEGQHQARAIGFRAEKECVRWAVVEGTPAAPVLVAKGKLRPPKIYGHAEILAWYREQVMVLVPKYGVRGGGVKHPETKNRVSAKWFPRLRIEGVLAEALHSAAVAEIVCGPYATMSSALDTKSSKAYLGDDDLRGLDWGKTHDLDKEAILVAACSLPNSSDGDGVVE